MAITKYEAYYDKIKESVVELKNTYSYGTESIGFAHWYLSNYYQMNTQNIAEAITDGGDDKGVDAIIIDEINQSLTIFQFKFPQKQNINGEISEGDVLKTWNGFETLVNNDIEYTGTNDLFRDYKNQLKETLITNFRIVFVSFNKGVVANRKELEQKADNFKRDFGSDIEIIYHDKQCVGDIYERINRENSLVVELKYKQMQSAYNYTLPDGKSYESYVGFVNAKDLVNSISSNIATIFDENIRLFEYGSSVNSSINRTATSDEEAYMFYFYSNGIVFICDKASNSPASNNLKLSGTSVVNGCQTLTVLYNAFNKGKLNDSVNVLVRVFEISDYSERMTITEYLNSQTAIKDSYFISNHIFVRRLQDELLAKGYYLERQVNEYRFNVEHGEKSISEKNILQLEPIIQYYVGFYMNKHASTAKRGKGALFDKNKIEEILSSISAEKVLSALECYNEISNVLTEYRKTRRNHEKAGFAEYLGISQDDYLEHIDEFKFVNTGDILLLNTVANLKQKYSELEIQGLSLKDHIVDAIFLIKDIAQKQETDNPSSFTKNNAVFTEIQNNIGKMSERYNNVL